MTNGDLELHLSLKHSLQAVQQHDQHLRKINRLHEKVLSATAEGDEGGGKGPEVSAKAAVKLFLAYEAAIKSCLSLEEYLFFVCERAINGCV
jgi:hypothetical protein